MKTTIILALLTIAFKIYSCPITITNDTNQRIIIVDPRGSETIFLEPNDTGVIDPTITNSMMQLILDEKLDFYYPDGTSQYGFYKKFGLTEKYCTDDPKESELTMSQIINFVQNPSDRFKVQELQPIKKDPVHKHS